MFYLVFILRPYLVVRYVVVDGKIYIIKRTTSPQIKGRLNKILITERS